MAIRNNDHIRKLRHIDRCFRNGRRKLAEIELHEWHRHEDCPPTVRIILAAIRAREDKFDEARMILDTIESRGPLRADPQETQLLISILTACGLRKEATRLVRRFYDAHGDNPQIAEWLRIMRVPGMRHLPAVPDAAVEHLASELISDPDVIPSIIFAFRHKPRSRDITLLRHAIARIAKEFETDSERMVMVCQAMADLAVLLGDDDDARRWAYRGLKLDPYSASLALILSRVTDDEAMGPPARTVLQRVSHRWPMYPDIRAALIRRERVDGRIDSARARLATWLQNDPNSPIARQLEKELAA